MRRALRFPRDSVTICLVPDARIARWNRAYRGKRGPTDVLSFPAGDRRSGSPRARRGLARAAGAEVGGTKPGGRPRLPAAAGPNGSAGSGYLGDIAIAPAVARRNAIRLGRSFERELRILILHGALHLAGHDHETDRGEMDRLERRLRRRLGLDSR